MTEPECVINSGGSKAWRLNGKLHRLDGPAVEYANGYRAWWYVNGVLHRLDGPAIEQPNGTKFWYVDGVRCTEQDFPKAIIMFLLNCDEQTTQFIIGALNERA